MTFSPANDQIRVQTYSPTRNGGNGEFQTDADSQFILSYNMHQAAPFQVIGTQTGGPSGSTTGVTTGSTWSFTTTVQPTTDPTIIITGTPLSPFSSEPGTPSAEKSYTVAGSNLTGSIQITAPANFQISKTSGSSFGSSLALPPSGGSVVATTIYVRFNRATAGTSTGNYQHRSRQPECGRQRRERIPPGAAYRRR